MKTYEQKPHYNCLLNAACCLWEVPYDVVIKELGIDPSANQWPEQPEPFNRRSLHLQEINEYALTHDRGMFIAYYARPMLASRAEVDPIRAQTCGLADVATHFTAGIYIAHAPSGVQHAWAMCFDALWNGKELVASDAVRDAEIFLGFVSLLI
jgi:hypothetical protein